MSEQRTYYNPVKNKFEPIDGETYYYRVLEDLGPEKQHEHKFVVKEFKYVLEKLTDAEEYSPDNRNEQTKEFFHTHLMFPTRQEANEYCERMNNEYIGLLTEYQDRANRTATPSNDVEEKNFEGEIDSS